MGRLLEAHKQIVSEFSPLIPLYTLKLMFTIIAESALFTTCLYFTMIVVLNQVGPLLTKYQLVS